MKKIIYVFAVLLAFYACEKVHPVVEEDITEENSNTVEEITPVENIVTIKATIEGGETKTTYTEDTGTMKAIVGWEAGDKISILYSNGGYKKYEFETTSGDGSFTGTPGGTEGGTYAYWAIYPYNICNDLYPSSSEPYKESTTITLPTEYTGSGADGIPMLAHTLKASFDGTYHLKHMGSVIRFKFTNIPSTARQLVISNDSRDLAGRYYTTYDSANDLVYYTSGTGDDGEQRSVTYSFTPGVDGKYTFYLPYGCDVSPSGNFTFTFKDSGGDEICSRTTTLGGLANVTLARNTMYRVNMNVIGFDGYPGLSSVAISPSSLPSTATSATKFTISGLDFYSYYVVKDGDYIKFSGDGGGSERIYNDTSLGTIVKIVVSNTATGKYYRDNYILYAGTSADPSSTTISYSATEGSGDSQTSTTYVLAGATDYTHFALKQKNVWSDRIQGTITIYYKAD
ncbi:MAG: hypothetical protein IJK44_01315 [Bacteroidales bacterium]|nr:hypothetical protein [Bacteroidales bacterium]